MAYAKVDINLAYEFCEKLQRFERDRKKRESHGKLCNHRGKGDRDRYLQAYYCSGEVRIAWLLEALHETIEWSGGSWIKANIVIKGFGRNQNKQRDGLK